MFNITTQSDFREMNVRDFLEKIFNITVEKNLLRQMAALRFSRYLLGKY